MGMLLAAMAGAGDAGVKSMDQEIDQLGRQDLLNQQSKLQLQSAQALEQYKLDLADQVRKRDAQDLTTATDAEMNRRLVEKVQAARVNTLTADSDPGSVEDGGKTFTSKFVGDAEAIRKTIADIKDPTERARVTKLLDDQVSRNRSRVGTVDFDSITPEERTKYALDDKERALALHSAALSTGQLSAKDALVLNSKEGALATQLALGQMRGEYQTAIASARLEAANARTQAQYEAAMAKVEALVAKAQGGDARSASGIDLRAAEGLTEQAKALSKQIEMMPDGPEKTKIQTQISMLNTQAQGLINRAIGGAPVGGAGAPAPTALPPLGNFEKPGAAEGAKPPSAKPAAAAKPAAGREISSTIDQENFPDDAKRLSDVELYAKYKDRYAGLRPEQKAIIDKIRARVNSYD